MHRTKFSASLAISVEVLQKVFILIFCYLIHCNASVHCIFQDEVSRSGFPKTSKDQVQVSVAEDSCLMDKTCKSGTNLKYILYNVNPGEGFNLRRDIYVRLAPLVENLNKRDINHKWILVLPVWANLPHWDTTPKSYPWKTYFQLNRINEYIPAMEFEDFMDEYGFENNLDGVFQLQHFPFNVNEDWRDKIETNVKCQEQFKFQKNGNMYAMSLWNHRIVSKRAECMGFRGSASTLLDFILDSGFRSVFFEHAEVILWDSYGDANWWRARQSLQFSTNLLQIAKNFIQSNILDSYLKSNNNSKEITSNSSYIGVHLRRNDFVNTKTEKQVPSMESASSQVYAIMQMLDLYRVFLATDASKEEILQFKAKLTTLSTDDVEVLQFTTTSSSDLGQGEIAIIDQIICSWSTYFIGTKDSTFTTRIFEEREILGFDINLTFNSFCPASIEVNCEQPTQWKLVTD